MMDETKDSTAEEKAHSEGKASSSSLSQEERGHIDTTIDDGNAISPSEKEPPSTDKQPDATTTQAKPNVPPPPNGGYGWVVTVCTAVINAHTWGLNSSYGVFLAHYLRNHTFPGATALDYAFVGSLSISCAMFISPVATTCTRYFGSHTTLFVGVAFETASLIGASFVKEIWQLFLSQGVCFGLGLGFLFIGSVPIIPQWFTTKRSLASGIGAAGSGLGGLTYSLAVQAMIKSIGLAWSFRVLGIVSFVVNGVCSALMRDRNKIIGSKLLAFDANIFVRLEYILLGLWGWFSMLGYVVLIFSLANYANSVGLSDSQAALISALFNLGQFLGRPPIGYFSDSIGRINMAMVTTFICGLFALVIWDFADSFGVLVFYAIIGGTCAGTFWCTIGPVTAEVVGLKHVPSGLNLMWLTIGLPVTFSEPIALEIVAGTGSYRGTQLWTGFMYIAGSLCLLLLRGWKMGELDELAKMKEEGDEDLENVEAESPLRALKAGRKTLWKHALKWRKV